MATRDEKLRYKTSFALLALLAAHWSAPAYAAAPDDAAKERARELMAKGRKARAGADLAGALESFREADEIMHVPTTGLELAKALRDLGRLVAAAEVIARVEAIPEGAAEPGAFATARSAAKEMKLELDARIPSLRITSSPADPATTRLTLDGKPVEAEQAARGLRLDPGRHVATAERGGSVQERVVELAESGSADVAFEFTPPRDTTPSTEARRTGTPSSTYVIYGLTGLAAVGLGSGVGLALWSNSRRATLERECAPRCSAQQVTDVRIGYVAANVTTAIGVASGLAALTLYFVRDGRRPPRRGATRSISITPTGPGVTLSGTF